MLNVVASQHGAAVVRHRLLRGVNTKAFLIGTERDKSGVATSVSYSSL